MAWAWCSVRIASSAVMPCVARRASTSARTGRHEGSVLAHPLEQAHDVGGVECWGSGPAVPGPHDLVEVAVGLQPRGAPLQRFLGQAAQVLDERELEHAGPGPQFADGEWRDGLVGGHEPHELARSSRPSVWRSSSRAMA